jgi:AcrR family transcriptional regulator
MASRHDSSWLTLQFIYDTFRNIMSQVPTEKLKRGRPRSEVAYNNALSVAREILLTEGFGRLTMEAVASRSGVSKPTLYRHWANAQQLAMAALVPPVEDTEAHQGRAARARLVKQLETLIETFATTRGRQIALTLASADPDSEYTRAFRNRVLLTSRETGREILQSAVAKGELAAPADFEAVLDMIYGPIFYRLLMGHLPLTKDLAAAIVDRIWAGQLAVNANS